VAGDNDILNCLPGWRLTSRCPNCAFGQFWSCHVISCHVMSCHVMSCHVMSCHVMSFHESLTKSEVCRVKYVFLGLWQTWLQPNDSIWETIADYKTLHRPWRKSKSSYVDTMTAARPRVGRKSHSQACTYQVVDIDADRLTAVSFKIE
jgi:hypothetical protein